MARTTSLVVVPLTTSTAWYFSCTCFFCLFLLFPFWQKHGVYHIYSTGDKNTHVHHLRVSCCRWESFRPWRLSCRMEGNQSEHCMLHLDTMRRWVLLQKKCQFQRCTRCTCLFPGKRTRWGWACRCRSREDVTAKRRTAWFPPWWRDVCYAGQLDSSEILLFWWIIF